MRKCPKFIVGRIQGKTVGGGVGLASATDYCMATKFAAIKLSELNVGIGPFVVGPVVQRKLGISAMSQLAIDANSFYSLESYVMECLSNNTAFNKDEIFDLTLILGGFSLKVGKDLMDIKRMDSDFKFYSSVYKLNWLKSHDRRTTHNTTQLKSKEPAEARQWSLRVQLWCSHRQEALLK